MLSQLLADKGGNSAPSYGIGLRHCHIDHVSQTQPFVDWFEVHCENYMMDQGPRKEKLLSIRRDYPLSLHGVCLSLGSADGLDLDHLQLLKNLIEEIDPYLVSDHLSWGRFQQTYFQDLLPIPYTKEALTVFCDNLQKAQEFLKCPLLIENPSSYLLFPESTFEEASFLKEIIKKTGCQVLLDVNNIYVACHNHKWNAYDYIDTFSSSDVGEIHLAGHSPAQEDQDFLIDTHSTAVCEKVWNLYEHTIRQLGGKPTLIEWDADLPDFSTLQKEADKARFITEKVLKNDDRP